MTTKEILKKIEGDEEKICLFSEIIDEILEDCEDLSKYEDSFHVLIHGPHHTQETLEKSGIPLKYNYQEIQRVMLSSGISFDDCITPEDIVFIVNSLYKTYYPLIPDLSHAVKFADRYINEDYPVKNGRAYTEWKNSR